MLILDEAANITQYLRTSSKDKAEFMCSNRKRSSEQRHKKFNERCERNDSKSERLLKRNLDLIFRGKITKGLYILLSSDTDKLCKISR